MRERDREITVVLHMAFFGTEAQAKQSTAAMLRYMEVRGANVISATHNDDPIEAAKA